RLRNRNGEGPRGTQRTAVAILGRVFHRDRDRRKLLDDVAPDESGVPRCAAGHDFDPPYARAAGGGEVEPVEAGAAFVAEQTSPQRAPHRLGLLADLLEHEVGVLAEAQALEVPVD